MDKDLQDRINKWWFYLHNGFAEYKGEQYDMNVVEEGIIERWNRDNLPFNLKLLKYPDNVELQVWKRELDNVEGDVNLEDTWNEIVFTIREDTFIDAKNLLNKIDLKYLR